MGIFLETYSKPPQRLRYKALMSLKKRASALKKFSEEMVEDVKRQINTLSRREIQQFEKKLKSNKDLLDKLAKKYVHFEMLNRERKTQHVKSRKEDKTEHTNTAIQEIQVFLRDSKRLDDLTTDLLIKRREYLNRTNRRR